MFRMRNDNLQGFVNLPVTRWRRRAFFALVLLTTVFGIATMFHVLNANGVTMLEGLILVLFSVTFGWITVAFWTAAAGFAFQLLKLDPLSLRKRYRLIDPRTPITARTAVVMPAYNENTERIVAGLEATFRDLEETGEADRYDFYLLSDSNDPDIAEAEEWAMRALCTRLKAENRLFYRRRERNVGRKAGNIGEFCRKWGAYYVYMVVLDADSVMTGRALVELTRAMQANPSAGIIQTVPIPVRARTMFGRFMQFAASLSSPMLATGMAFWQGEAANYWGHNAIIRTNAFMAHCGLPSLSGEPPLGGDILSHDFVEAALMRRGGYHVYLFPELEGSYEELPGNVLDYAKRDRRWAEGNIQHLRLLTAHGLHPLHRLNFVLGAFAYLCSFLWLCMLCAGTVDALGRALSANEFFASSYQLFPDWPVTRTDEMMSLLWIVIGLLLLPKLMAILLAMFQSERRRLFGGGAKLLASAVIEVVFSILIAPVMMFYHAYFVTSILLGRRVVWNPQCRDGNYVPVRTAVRTTALMTCVGIAWAIGTAYFTPLFAVALTPVLAGLLLAAPLVSASSSAPFGMWLFKRHLFMSPCESSPPGVLRNLQGLLKSNEAKSDESSLMSLPALPPVILRDMPAQTVDRGPRWNRSVVGHRSA